MSLVEKLFGSFSDRELKKINPIAKQVLALEGKYAALSDADEVLYYQGYSLDVIARTENAVQAGLVDSNGDPVDNGAILDNAMTAAGFAYADGWYILTSEDTAP